MVEAIVATGGQPTVCASEPSSSPAPAVGDDVSGSIACVATPANRPRASSVAKSRATAAAGSRPSTAYSASARDGTGGRRIDERTASATALPPATSGCISRRLAASSLPRPAAVSGTERVTTAARPPSSGCAYTTSGCANRTPRAAGSKRRKNGDASASGCAAEHTSCRKPGSVSSSVRQPPPGVAAPSITCTRSPAAARVTAAARPFGPLPTTIASASPGMGITR